jgi:hypothetical protein
MTSSRIRWFRSTFLVSLALVAATAGSAAAQQRTSVLPVDSLARVRMTQSAVEPSRLRGTFLSADSQTVVVQGAEARYEVPLAEIRKLEVSRGERTVEGGAWRGAQVGFLGGLITGAVFGGMVIAIGEGDSYVSDEQIVGILVVTGTTLGTALGTLGGALFPGERWERVPLPR